MNSLRDKHLLVIVTGGIAAYKTLELVRRARDAGAIIKVVMTGAAQQFVTPLSFQALSGQAVHTELLDASAEAGMGHIELARWADRILVVPASADFMARLAHGLADDLASTICLASGAPILVVPSMNQQMWLNAATQQNLQRLRDLGMQLIGPAEGSQACGETGPGRMVEVPEILAAVGLSFQSGQLSGRRVLITAGPTQEAIDPVRFISNRSSGKMGYALARAAAEAGATVHLVSGPTQLQAPSDVVLHPVISAADMFNAVMSLISEIDIFIAAAAVADYTFAKPEGQKRKKSESDLSLTLAPTQDILSSVSSRPQPPFCVGFAAETENLADNAKAKLKRKSLHMIAANDVSAPGIGFDSDKNALLVLWDGGETRLDVAAKDEIARQLLALIAQRIGVEAQTKLK